MFAGGGAARDTRRDTFKNHREAIKRQRDVKRRQRAGKATCLKVAGAITSLAQNFKPKPAIAPNQLKRLTGLMCNGAKSLSFRDTDRV